MRNIDLSRKTSEIAYLWKYDKISLVTGLSKENKPEKMVSCRVRFLSKLSAGDTITRTISAGSHFSRIVSAGSKRSRTVSAEAKYDGQSRREAKIGVLVYTLWPYASLVSPVPESSIGVIGWCNGAG